MKTLYQINVFMTCFWLPTSSQTFNSLFCYLKIQTLLSIIHLLLQPIISSWFSLSIEGLFFCVTLNLCKCFETHITFLSFLHKEGRSQDLSLGGKNFQEGKIITEIRCVDFWEVFSVIVVAT